MTDECTPQALAVIAALTERWKHSWQQINDHATSDADRLEAIRVRDAIVAKLPYLRTTSDGRSEDEQLEDLMADKTIGRSLNDSVATAEPESEIATTTTTTAEVQYAHAANGSAEDQDEVKPRLILMEPEPVTAATTAAAAEVELDVDRELAELLGRDDPRASESPHGNIQRLLRGVAPAAGVPLVTRIANMTRSSRLSAEEAERESRPVPPPKRKFTMLPLDVYRSPQFLALDQHTKLLLYQVSHEVWRSNGFIRLTDAELGRWGWRGHSTGQKAIREAVAFKFLRITKRGNAAARIPTFYFPTWEKLPGEKAAPNTWRTIAPKVKTKKRKAKPAAVPITKAA